MHKSQLSVIESMNWVDTTMMFNLAIGAFVIFGGFGLLTIVADYILPALFPADFGNDEEF
jgi:hypothetical protein